MAWRRACEAMVHDTIAARGVENPTVLRAMQMVPRHRFVTTSSIEHAYADYPMSIAHGQTISQPYIVAAMAELAAVAPGHRVLDVGTGSGYQAAVLAEMGAEVVSIERLAELHHSARATLNEVGYRSVTLVLGDGRNGWPDCAPYDAILVAAATPQVPEALIDQLAVEGKLVIPIGDGHYQELVVLQRMPWGEIRRRSVMRVLFVPLR